MTLKYRILPNDRIPLLKNMFQKNNLVRVMEVHDGLSALIANNAEIIRNKEKTAAQYDALWISSLTDSAAKGHPDTSVIDYSSRLLTINEITQITNKPIIVDGDTGGDESQFEYFCSKLEMLGVSAVIIEDKVFPKRNSLDSSSIQLLEDPVRFATKINRAKAICLTKSFMIFARIESFIAGEDINDAIKRAEIYLKSDADGILIHSNKKTPSEVFAFAESYKKLCKELNIYKPLICIPTSYSSTYEPELFKHGFNIVIYANQLLRAAHKAMTNTALSILEHESSFEITPYLSSVQEIFNEVGFLDVQKKDLQYTQKIPPVILLAAGKPIGFKTSEFVNLPITHIPIDKKTLLEKQINILQNSEVKDITVVTGYQRKNLDNLKVNEIFNERFSETRTLYSLFLAEDKMRDGFIMIYGDVIFDDHLFKKILDINDDVVLLIDPKIKPRKPHTEKLIDLVVTNLNITNYFRKLSHPKEMIQDIGANIDYNKANYEFIGIAKFSAQGAEIFRSCYHNLCKQVQMLPRNTVDQFDFADVIRYMIQQNINIDGLVVHDGWSEVHSEDDIKQIEKITN